MEWWQIALIALGGLAVLYAGGRAVYRATSGWRSRLKTLKDALDEAIEADKELPALIAAVEKLICAIELQWRTESRAAGLEVWTLAGGAPGDGVLFDSSHGDGETEFRKGEYKAVVAGGISAANVGEALKLEPDVVDVNSSIETAPGVKSVEMLDSLLDEFKKAIER